MDVPTGTPFWGAVDSFSLHLDGPSNPGTYTWTPSDPSCIDSPKRPGKPVACYVLTPCVPCGTATTDFYAIEIDFSWHRAFHGRQSGQAFSEPWTAHVDVATPLGVTSSTPHSFSLRNAASVDVALRDASCQETSLWGGWTGGPGQTSTVGPHALHLENNGTAPAPGLVSWTSDMQRGASIIPSETIAHTLANGPIGCAPGSPVSVEMGRSFRVDVPAESATRISYTVQIPVTAAAGIHTGQATYTSLPEATP